MLERAANLPCMVGNGRATSWTRVLEWDTQCHDTQGRAAWARHARTALVSALAHVSKEASGVIFLIPRYHRVVQPVSNTHSTEIDRVLAVAILSRGQWPQSNHP